MDNNKYQLDDEFCSLKVYDYVRENEQMGREKII